MGDLAEVKRHIEAGVAVDIRSQQEFMGSTPLIEASKGGHRDVVDFLLKNHAYVNLCDITGWTALMYAAEEGKRYCHCIFMCIHTIPLISIIIS